MPADATTGQVIVDRYELLEELGRGPIGVVWRARDLRLQREVAVREAALPDLLDEAEQAVLAEKILREARAAALLDHPAVVSVLDVVDEDGRPFVVTELFDAPTLQEVVGAEGPLAPERAATIGLELLSALAAAHAEGLVHRDVRPSNVLLPPWGGARLADFGVASMIDDPRIAASDAAPASSYLAPERTGTAGASAASDLWSLGATLYFAVEGVPPFDEDEPAATLDAIREHDPRPTERAGRLQVVLDRLLVKDPLARADHAAIRELLTSLDEPSFADGSETWAVGGRASAGLEGADVDGAGSAIDTPTGLGTDARDDAATSAPTGSEAGAEATEAAAASTDGNGVVEGGLTHEPWFFADLTVEAVPGAPRPPEPPGEPVPPWPQPKRPGRRLPRSLLVTVLALGVGAVMLALVVTNGRLNPSGPELTEVDAGDVTQWVPYTDGTAGFTIRYPEGWAVRRSGSITDFVDPRKPGTYVRIDHATPPPASQEAAWLEQEKTFSTRFPDYSRIRIAPTTFQTFPGATWEFTYSDRDVALRALEVGFSAGRYGFALTFQGHAEDWDELQPVFEAFKAAFRAPA